MTILPAMSHILDPCRNKQLVNEHLSQFLQAWYLKLLVLSQHRRALLLALAFSEPCAHTSPCDTPPAPQLATSEARATIALLYVRPGAGHGSDWTDVELGCVLNTRLTRIHARPTLAVPRRP